MAVATPGEWRHAFRSAKAMVQRAHDIADASLGPLPKLKPKQAGTRKKQSQPKLPKPVPKQLQSAKQKVRLGLRYTCDGTCKKAKKVRAHGRAQTTHPITSATWSATMEQTHTCLGPRKSTLSSSP